MERRCNVVGGTRPALWAWQCQRHFIFTVERGNLSHANLISYQAKVNIKSVWIDGKKLVPFM